MAWIVIGLLRAYKVLGKTEYLEAAKKLGTWIKNNVRDDQVPGGYTGGFKGWEAQTQPNKHGSQRNIISTSMQLS